MSNKIYIIIVVVLAVANLLLGGYALMQKNSNTVESGKYVYKTFYSDAEDQWYVGVAGYLDNTCQEWFGLKGEVNGKEISVTGYYATSEEMKENNEGVCIPTSFPFQDYAFIKAPKDANFTFKIVEGEMPE